MAVLEGESLLVRLRQLVQAKTGPGDEEVVEQLAVVRLALGAAEVFFWWPNGEEEWWGFSVHADGVARKGRLGCHPHGAALRKLTRAARSKRAGNALLVTRGGQGLLFAVSGEAIARPWPEELLAALMDGLAARMEACVTAGRLSRAQSDLQALSRISGVISSTSDFHLVLGQCIEQMKDIIGAASGGVLLHDPESNRLVLQRPAFDSGEEGFHGYALDVVGEEKAGMGAAVRVFITGQPYISNSPAEDPISNRQIIDLYGVLRSLTVPLEVHNRRLGVLHLVNKRSGDFNQEDARLATLLASQLAVVIVNARLFAQLDAQNRLLQRAIDIHDRLTQMVLQGRDTDVITLTLAQLLGRAVRVEDPSLKLISFAAPPGVQQDGPVEPEMVDERIFVASEVQEFLANLEREQRPLSFPTLERHGLSTPRIMAAIRAGGETLGYVSVLAAGRCLEDLDYVALEHAATVYALKFMQQKVAYEVEERIRGRFVEDLVYGRAKEERDILERARYLGYDQHHVYQVMIIQTVQTGGTEGGKEPAGESGCLEPQAAVVDLVHQCAAQWGHKLIAARTNPLLVLVDNGLTGQEQRIEELAGVMQKRLKQETGAEAVLVCIGGPASSVRELQLSYRQAEKGLQMARRFGRRDAVVPYSALGVFRILLHVDNQQVLSEYTQEVLGRLLAYDGEKNGNLLGTLRAYVENNFNAQRTAERLYIHLNTLKYRLQRIREVAQLDLDDPEQRLNIQLALKMLDVLDDRAP